MDSAILNQVFADLLTGLRDSIEAIAGIGNNPANRGLKRNRLAGHGIEAHPVSSTGCGGLIQTHGLSRVEAVRQERGRLQVGVELRLNPVEADAVVEG